MTIELRVVIETVVGLVLSGCISLSVYAINAKVNQRYLQLKLDLAENYVTNKALEALIVRFEKSIAKLEETGAGSRAARIRVRLDSPRPAELAPASPALSTRPASSPQGSH